jgi:hypothetical protein
LQLAYLLNACCTVQVRLASCIPLLLLEACAFLWLELSRQQQLLQVIASFIQYLLLGQCVPLAAVLLIEVSVLPGHNLLDNSPDSFETAAVSTLLPDGMLPASDYCLLPPGAPVTQDDSEHPVA